MGQFIQKIALRGVQFNSAHGWYPEEQLTTNRFTVDLEASFVKQATNEELERTLNYEIMNLVIRDAMATPRKLLETVAEEILKNLLQKFPFVETAQVSITKHQPAMPGNVGASIVTLNFTK